LSQSGADVAAQRGGDPDGDPARDALHEAGGPRGLLQRDLPRTKRRGADRRRRAGVATLLRKTCDVSDATRSGDPRRTDPIAERELAAAIPRSLERSPRHSPRTHARAEDDHAGRARCRSRVAAQRYAISEDVAQRAVLRRSRDEATSRNVSGDAARDRGAAHL